MGSSLIKDLCLVAEKNAKLKQVTRNIKAKIVVVLTNTPLVLVPNIDSAAEKLSANPPPRPDCISTTIVKKIQTTT